METAIHFSSKSDEWATPPELLRPLSIAVGGFDLDPCSGAEERTIARRVLTEREDGLSEKWYGSVWMNPPYSDVSSWMEKALNESRRGVVSRVVTLVPARTSTQWFHSFAIKSSILCFLEGRLSFGDSDNSAPFPSCIAVFGEPTDELLEVLERKGAVYHNQELWKSTKQTKFND